MDGKGNVVKGIVLAGGQGTRLRPLSYYFQKCMIPIGHKQKPLLEYIVRLMKHHGITNIYLLAGYKHEQIVNYFNSGERFGVTITCIQDDPNMSGTGASLVNLYRTGFVGPNETLLVYYGDILSDIDLTELLKSHCERAATATLVLSRGYQVNVGLAETKGRNVVGWIEKPTLELNVGTGVIVLHASALQELEGLSKRHAALDIMSHLVPHLLAKNEIVNAYMTNAFWYDVGSAERYEKIDNDVIQKRFEYLFT